MSVGGVQAITRQDFQIHWRWTDQCRSLSSGSAHLVSPGRFAPRNGPTASARRSEIGLRPAQLYDPLVSEPFTHAELVHEALQALDERTWAAFSRKFRREMSAPDRSRELDMLAALSHQTNLSVGCYCEDERTCHRSVLRELLGERGADVV